MPDELAIVHTVADTGGGTQDITDSAITDFTGAIIIVNGATALSTDTAHARQTIAFCDSSGTMISTARRSEDGAPSLPETVTWGSQSLLQIAHPTATSATAPNVIGTAEAIARSVSGVANGIRLNWTNTPDAAYRMTVLLFGGSTNVAVGQASVPTTAALVSLGFEPDFVAFGMQHGNYGATSGATLDYDSCLGFAVNDGSETQASIVLGWETATEPTVTEGYVSTVECGAELNSGVENHATVTGFSASGFTWDAESSVIPAQYFALEFSEARSASVAIETLPGSTGNQAFTGLGLQPEVVLGMATLIATNDSINSSALSGSESVFLFDGTDDYSHATHSEEGLTITNPPTSNAQSRTENTALWLPDDSGTVAVNASHVSMDATGFTLNFTTATAGRMLVFAVERLVIDRFAAETVEVSEDIVIVRSRSQDETVQISEQVLPILGRMTEQAETVEISEGVVTQLYSRVSTFRHGSTLQAGGSRGSSLQSGAQHGFTI
jgi:hypothetical protein